MSRGQVSDGRAYNRPDGRRWYLSATHPTGIPMDPQLCEWFHTRDQARERLADLARTAAAASALETLRGEVVS